MFRIIEDLVFCFCCGPEFLRVCTHMKRQRVRALVVARTRQNLGCSHRLRACVPATNRYGIIFNGIWHHIYWDMASYLLEYGIIFIGMWHHNYWNMESYLLECGIIIIGMWHHIYWNVASYLLEYVSCLLEYAEVGSSTATSARYIFSCGSGSTF